MAKRHIKFELSEDEAGLLWDALESRIEMLEGFEGDEEAEAQVAEAIALQKRLGALR